MYANAGAKKAMASVPAALKTSPGTQACEENNVGRKRLLHYTVVAVFCIAGVATNAWLRAHAPPPDEHIKDFMTLYMGAKLVGTPGLYNEQAGWKVQDETVGRHSKIIPYVRLPFVAFLAKPLTRLQYDNALRTFYLLIILALAVTVWLLPGDRLITLLVICWSEPVAACFGMAQDTVFLLVSIALCFLLYRRDRHVLAGFALSLCLWKYHLIIFVPLAMLLQKKWSLAAGFTIGCLGLLGLSFAVQGWNWPVDYIHEILTGNSQPWQHLMYDIRGALSRWPHPLALHLIGSAIVACITLYICWHSEFEIATCCCLLAGLMTSLHVFDQDYVLIIPLCALLLSRAKEKPAIVLLLCVPFAYFRAGAVMLLSLLALISVARSSRTETQRFPIR